jgi:hypothetical protein
LDNHKACLLSQNAKMLAHFGVFRKQTACLLSQRRKCFLISVDHVLMRAIAKGGVS